MDLRIIYNGLSCLFEISMFNRSGQFNRDLTHFIMFNNKIEIYHIIGGLTKLCANENMVDM